mmetsp:Transcript_28357/g.52214  ORF Transcript_28357/g.52214 Transcript_28357/m.52214 type:complete len:90 (+) Transcript_28357:95-364(+)|eukprot:CAMPEP_0175073664 /NCGR_PEP_ID=MMETSP0052_2-20121109/20737_1 /TAXON_ID=51329 ORGANISM="Polytomella parva, Strain SAG 63-3" /NCGR_SAMPLE_ID=MMETSP0052_2 /ASSEMBLY_ACC=CAM_ASM_000194 /LENGTH=89 /DNA_ID=CAMNT_0016341597 /DNA_START=11 /DNA_END=280 /DNA_ORIENTATION=-
MNEAPDIEKFGNEYFEDTHKLALRKKTLFKEYMMKHNIMDELNKAIGNLYKQENLPDNPLEFISQQIAPSKVVTSQYSKAIASKATSKK